MLLRQSVGRVLREGKGRFNGPSISRYCYSYTQPLQSPAPFDYLRDSYFIGVGDRVVWASRGGGKTMLGAAATLLDLLFYPGIQIRVLGGSLNQSEKMYAHLRSLLDREVFRGGGGVLQKEPTSRKIWLANGSEVQLLAASQRSIRGTRVHILRCDEVEEMDPEVWSAAQLVTRSGLCGGRRVAGRVEAFSTLHRPMGLMSQLIGGKAQRDHGDKPAIQSTLPRKVYRWNALDVIERCPPARDCSRCVLWRDCGGRAKQADGFVSVDDLIAQRGRVSDAVWEAEMMCHRPSVSDCVYPAFSLDRHVCNGVDPPKNAHWIGGMDFGMRSPTTLLWAFSSGTGVDSSLHVVGEYTHSDRTVETNLDAAGAWAESLGLPIPQAFSVLAVDPAGAQRSGQTGQTDIQVLRSAGCHVAAPRAPLALGIEAVRRRLDHGRLTIHPRCTQLIDAMRAYHFDSDHPHRPQPVKDGPDHLCDALRYMVLAQDRGGGAVTTRSY